MATIVIHHHAEDAMAAEVIGGALLPIGAVRLAAWPSPQPETLDWTAEHLIVWTPDLAACAAFFGYLQSLAARRAHCSLLVHAAVAPPHDVIACPSLPLFDATTPWTAYRRALRATLLRGIPDSEPVYGPPPGPLDRLLHRLPDDLPSGPTMLMLAAIAAIALFR